MKLCKDCQIEKPLSDFYKNNQTKDGLTYYCRPCQTIRSKKSENYEKNVRKANLKKKYGITLEDYDSLLKRQKGVCDICKLPEPESSRFNYLCVDHDHNTGVVRGLLCYNCNTALGKFMDSPDNLRGAIFYLEKAQAKINSHIRKILIKQMEETK